MPSYWVFLYRQARRISQPDGVCIHSLLDRAKRINHFGKILLYLFDFLHKEGLEVSGSILVEPLLLLKRSTERLLYAQAFFPID